VAGPEALARHIVILLDGAAAVMLVHRDVAYVVAAGELAGKLVQAGSRRPVPRI
jgi:hypothetical protein